MQPRRKRLLIGLGAAGGTVVIAAVCFALIHIRRSSAEAKLEKWWGVRRSAVEKASHPCELVNGEPRCLIALEAGKALVKEGKPAVPFLIGKLESQDRHQRFDAYCLLGMITKKAPDFDYDFDGPASARKAAVQKWREWWERNEATFVMPDAEQVFSPTAAFK